VGESPDLSNVLGQIAELEAGIILMDSVSGPPSNLQFISRVRDLYPHVHVVMVGMDPKEGSFLSAVMAGISGYPFAIVAAIAQHIRSSYESSLHACNAVDFDDLILLTLRLFKKHPDALAACRAKFRYVMVDEYQDTNAAQFELVNALTQQHRNLCVVGDDDQSIYGWRGAEIANLLDMEKHFPEVKVIKLEQNYRSTNTILGAANAVIKNNACRRGKKV